MPLSRRAELAAEKAKFEKHDFKYGILHVCRKCGAVHHYYDVRCHNPKCYNDQPLIKKEQNGE